MVNIAVVGSGVSGLAATWLLNEHSDHEVHLFEKGTYVGGHTHTVPFKQPRNPTASPVPVDTGFIVFNEVTYPNFLRFLELKKINITGSDMSFAVSRDAGEYEWAGKTPATLFAQWQTLFSPAQWRLVWDIIRFNAFSTEILEQVKSEAKASSSAAGQSIGRYIEKEGYSESFKNNYLLPMTAAIWSTPPDRCALDFPAQTLIRFMHNHHLLQLFDRPRWLTIQNGSISYINAITKSLPPKRLHLNTAVTAVTNTGEGQVMLTLQDGSKQVYDHVILAVHADEALEMLLNGADGATREEAEILGGFQFNKNVAYLHSDPDLMPKRRVAWSAWNYMTKSEEKSDAVDTISLTYWMNLLQNIDEKEHGDVLVTLNPLTKPKPALTVGHWNYEHPLYTEQSVASQGNLHRIQAKRGVTFAGAWTNYGFHEDGFTSGLRVATTYLGVKPPFEIRSAERQTRSDALSEAGKLIIECLDFGRRLLEPFFVAAMIMLVFTALAWEHVLMPLELALRRTTSIAPGILSRRRERAAGTLRESRQLIRQLRKYWATAAGRPNPRGPRAALKPTNKKMR
ncbi:uncharacterized protein L969DRAFT_47250 [Mixia osmundae IAM 14324]|uniref:Amine oxidase domain-containing protein n=1 Tax=Mixia osmundae (strain CBS 9802 / IAM 14324 / JCM 22182 / KY 12970) TaxID=764103 RepID=G7E9Y2_MIXOS|nr:uncharacterized protein L969DRAFT_47250 [Mixia osmundae IAM 14324]KEI40085.1 hypothetical protein L969DRAFT_47250 [Mixia osmundae IAM 14324]GAA99451.1 hypothetical protein E5Q_06150 [Mixia osmundae IAM 14324]